MAKDILAFWQYSSGRGSTLKSTSDELLQSLHHDMRRIHVVVMPDFFLDRVISLGKYDVPSFTKALVDVTKRKGGSIDGIAQADLRGGNAVNTASALAAMGARVTPIVFTNSFGLQQLRFRLKSRRIDLSHVKTEESA